MMNRTILLDTQHHASIRTREGFSQKKCCRRVADVAKLWGVGGIGIRAGFRYQCLRTWEFKSLAPYQTQAILRFSSIYIFYKNCISEFMFDRSLGLCFCPYHLGSSSARCEGSSPFRPTKGLIVNEY